MKIFNLVIAILVFQYGMSQQKETIVYLNDAGQPVKEKSASYLLQKLKINDTLWEFNTYDIYGPLVKSVHAKDENGFLRTGKYYSHDDAVADTTGWYTNNMKDSAWYVFHRGDSNVHEIIYKNGILINEVNKVSRNTPPKKSGDSAVSKTVHDSINIGKDVIFLKVEIESSFRGGISAWATYLQKNLRYPERAIKKRIEGTVIVQFIVNKQGKVEDVQVVKSVEYSLDQEALRIIRSSPEWTPAMQNGRVVKSYKKQPIIFRLQ